MPDVAVIGAGLAGLRCAALLAEGGRDVVVLEAADVVGGRQRTDEVDGFLLDRGFQVLNPAYPAVRRAIDVPALGLRSFPVGVQVRTARGLDALWHPLRYPHSIAATLRTGLVTPRDAIALARWVAPAFVRTPEPVGDVSLHAGWDAAGFRGPLRSSVLEPFLTGVLADDGDDTSNAFARWLVRLFVLGRPGLPPGGIASVPAQLARRAQSAGARIVLGARATAEHPAGGGVEIAIDGGDTVTAGYAVVAVGPAEVSGLTGVPRPATRGLQTWWFAVDAAPPASALLTVDGRRNGPVVNTVVMSRTVPSYAPSGRHLVAATCLMPSASAPPTEADVRQHLEQIWGADVTTWLLLRRDDIPDALPAQTAPLRGRGPAHVGDRLLIAGDHRDTASINGALVSGERAAHAVMGEPPQRSRRHARRG